MTFEDSVVDGIPMPACVLRDGRIVAANARFAAMQGRDHTALLASANPFEDFISAKDSARLAERHRARVRGEPVPDDYDFVGRRADGSAIHGRARAGPFPLAGPGTILWICTDEGERERGRALIRGFVDVAVEAQRQTTVEDLFRVVREKLAELGLTFTLFAIEPQGYRVLGVATGPFMQLVRNRWPTWIPPGTFSISAPEGQQGLLIDDVPGMIAEAFDAARMPAPASALRAVVAAIPVEGGAGYLLASSGEHLDSTIASAFGLFGKQLGAAIDNSRKLSRLSRSNRELRAVNEVAFASATLGSGRAMQSALEQLIDSLDLDSAALFRQSPGGDGALELIGEQGFEPGWARGVANDRESPWAEAAASGEPVLFQLDDAGQVNASGRRIGTPSSGLPRLGSSETLQALEPASCIALPLQISDQVNGVLIAARQGRPLGADDLGLLGTVAAQVAVALQNATLLEQARRRVDELSLLLELGHEVVATLDLPQVLRVAASVSARVLRCACAFVFLPDAERGLLRIHADHDPEMPSSVGVTLPLNGDSLTARAFHSQQAHWSIDSTTDPRTDAAEARRMGCRSTLAVPLVSHERSLGVLALIERSERVFDAQDVRLATHAAQLISAAIESAGLFDHERRRADEMARLQSDLQASYARLAHAQAELVERERLAALGELSASIAHEVRNPLGVIFNSMGSLRRILHPEGDAALLINIVEEEADRLNRMVGDLLDYSRPLRPSLQPVQLRALLEEAIGSARQQAGPDAGAFVATVRVEREVATVRADARLMRQALINLFLNAAQAMPRGGKLTVTARAGELNGVPAAEIAIADTGPGIPPETRTRIWQPFFTTKATGTGLGLAVVKRIVDGHGGSIALSRAEPFAEFRLCLPVGG